MEFLPAILFLGGFIFYASQTLRGRVTPHLGSWLVWACISVSNALTCVAVMDDWRNLIIPILDAMCVTAFVVTLWRRQEGKVALTRFDKRLIGAALFAASVAWFDPAWSILLVQIPLIVAVWPTLLGALEGDEEPVVWSVWSIAMLGNLAMTSGGFSQWVYPVIMFGMHAVVLGTIGVCYSRSARRALSVLER